MSGSPKNKLVYSIQRTYILTPVLKAEKPVITCDQRIDIPTIEPLSSVKPVSYDGQPLTLTIIPCIELAGEFLSEFNLTFETNEGVTVLPIKIAPGQDDPLENPYTHFRYVLALPSGATGIKSCKLIHIATGKEVQHNLTFGVMPPPYNYDSVLIVYSLYRAIEAGLYTTELSKKVDDLRLSSRGLILDFKKLPKGAGKQTIDIKDGVTFYEAEFSYPSSTEVTTHKPKITLLIAGRDHVYTLSLNKTKNTVLIDLLTGTITAYDSVTGEIIQQLKLSGISFGTLSFEDFDDIDTPVLNVTGTGRKLTTQI